MKKYLVIGNPIDHSLSPQLHNYWIKKNKINAIYESEKLNSDDLKSLVLKIRDESISGVNVTVPFKKEIIPHLDKLTSDAKSTQSVNTILLDNGKTVGHNTDISGFENAIKDIKYNLEGKKIFLLGSGGVSPSIIFALHRMRVSSIILSNRTKSKAEYLKNFYNEIMTNENNRSKIEVIDWGEMPEFNMVINSTSVGLKNDQKFDLDFSKVGKNKFFYDVIYNPEETSFLKTGKNLGNVILNGKLMFIYQALSAFNIWHGIRPDIDEKVIELLDND